MSSSTIQPAARRPRTAGLTAVVLTVLLTSFVAATYGFGFYLFAQLVTDMRADLGFGYTAVGVITAGGQFGFMLFALLGAWAAARFGGGQVIIGSVALCGAALVLLPLSDHIAIVGVLLVVLGGTAASVYVPMVEIVARAIGYQHRGKVLGLISSGTSYGVFVNSLLVPVFLRADNWRGVWWTVGSGTLVVTVVAAVVFWRLGLFRHTRQPTTGTGRTPPRTAARAMVVPWMLIIWSITFLNGFATMPFQNYLSPYLREGLDFSVEYSATVWGVIGFVGMFAGFLVGWFSDRTGVRLALLFCYGSILASAALLIVTPTGVFPVVAGVLFAVAFYPIFGLVPAYIAKTASGSAATTVFGVANVTLGVGGMLGNYLAGVLREVTESFLPIYAMIAVALVVLGALSLLLPREGLPEQPDARPAETDIQHGPEIGRPDTTRPPADGRPDRTDAPGVAAAAFRR
ncbi:MULTISPECIES: MFS transporter [unclassified Solwaraspora]|uniref:MFS transporter n=1 Tax=unclassified Solwaraspora TaxID=2627926 RepID=UPI00259B642D|nr:MFS transporter [Solwaraspora sp. WMMA2056]WJK38708.1 MFS transporter [Solwaraspora sp. WMMA2056]